MSAQIPAEALQLRSLVRADQTLELFLDMVPVPEPGPDEVVIRAQAIRASTPANDPASIPADRARGRRKPGRQVEPPYGRKPGRRGDRKVPHRPG